MTEASTKKAAGNRPAKTRKTGRLIKSGRAAVVITHGPFCLDGMAAAVCVGRFYGEPNVVPYFTHPSEVDRVIREVTLASKRVQDLWIADITWKQPETDQFLNELARKGWRIFWIDHHSNALEKTKEEIEAIGLTGWVVSNRFSAARLLYDYMISSEHLLGRMPARLKRFEKAVLLADDNDRWLHKRPGSRKLALTVAALGGMRIYRELMSVGSNFEYSSRMQEAYRTASRELAGSVALANRTRVERFMERAGIKIVAAICRGYTSEVAEALRQDRTPDGSMEAVFLLYNLDDGRISLRKTPACELDLARLAGRFGGGGHPAAAGFDLPGAGDRLQIYMLDHVGQVLES